MFGLGFQELMLVLILVGIPAAIWRATMRFARKHPDRQGIGGWSLIIALGVMLEPFILGWQTFNAFRYADWTGMEPNQIVVGRVLIGLLGGLFLAWAIYNAVLFFKRHRWFPWAWLGLNGLLTGVTMVMAIFDPDSRAGLFTLLYWTVIWGAYLFRSQRVKNTFVR
jgi:Protein of unknown function (DUF2569)